MAISCALATTGQVTEIFRQVSAALKRRSILWTVKDCTTINVHVWIAEKEKLTAEEALEALKEEVSASLVARAMNLEARFMDYDYMYDGAGDRVLLTRSTPYQSRSTIISP